MNESVSAASAASNGIAPPQGARAVLSRLATIVAAWVVSVGLLWYLHGSFEPEWALLPAVLGGGILPRALRSSYVDFPAYLRRPIDMGVVLLGTLLFSWPTMAREPSSYWLLRWREVVTLPILAAVLGLGLAGVIYSHTRMRREIEAAREREAALREAALRARLRALQAQINPHFLFNAFNALAELTHDDPLIAEQLVGDLAYLLRYSLRSSAAGTVPLAQEIEAIDRYLRVEAARLGDRLRVELDIEPHLGDVSIPGLVIQPLVENAVQHAVASRSEGGTIRLSARRQDGYLLISVQDDGPGLPDDAWPHLRFGPSEAESPVRPPGTGGAGGGLANVMQRLHLRYRGEASLQLSRLDPGTRIDLRIPL